MKVRYIVEHNNYALTLDKEYDAYAYKEGWFLVQKDDNGSKVLYRANCFEVLGG